MQWPKDLYCVTPKVKSYKAGKKIYFKAARFGPSGPQDLCIAGSAWVVVPPSVCDHLLSAVNNCCWFTRHRVDDDQDVSSAGETYPGCRQATASFSLRPLVRAPQTTVYTIKYDLHQIFHILYIMYFPHHRPHIACNYTKSVRCIHKT